MNITKMTDEELADKFQRFDFPIICEWKEFPKPEQDRYLTIAKFIRQCVKDSMLTKKEIKKIILENGTGVVGLHEDSRVIYPDDLARALRKAMEGSND